MSSYHSVELFFAISLRLTARWDKVVRVLFYHLTLKSAIFHASISAIWLKRLYGSTWFSLQFETVYYKKAKQSLHIDRYIGNKYVVCYEEFILMKQKFYFIVTSDNCFMLLTVPPCSYRMTMTSYVFIPTFKASVNNNINVATLFTITKLPTRHFNTIKELTRQSYST